MASFLSNKVGKHTPVCKNRSAWRLPPGKPPEALSPHYQLDCDFGTSMVISWKNDGTEPLYLCEEHAKELGPAPVRTNTSKANKVTEKAERTSEVHPQPPKPTHTIEERCSAINGQISLLVTQLEEILTQSQATINVASTIDTPLEQATLEIIGNSEMTDAQKDTAIEQLGAFQKSLKQDLGQDIAAIKAHRIKRAVEERVSTNVTHADETAPAYRAVYNSLENAIHSAVPQAKRLEERLANLFEMKASLQKSPQTEELERAIA
jgi:hypothetical protein